MASNKPPASVAAKTVSFGCLGVCRATDPYPIHIGAPGTHVYICALNTDIIIKFTGKSPFLSGSKKFIITAGTCAAAEIVAPANPGTRFAFTLKCASICLIPAQPPEMIVP